MSKDADEIAQRALMELGTTAHGWPITPMAAMLLREVDPPLPIIEVTVDKVEPLDLRPGVVHALPSIKWYTGLVVKQSPPPKTWIGRVYRRIRQLWWNLPDALDVLRGEKEAREWADD